MRIREVLAAKADRAVLTVAPDLTVRELLGRLAEHNVGALVVSRDGTGLDGIVSERDVVRCLHRRGTEILNATADAIMTSPVVVAAPTDSVAQAMTLMTERRIRHLPVMERGRLVGLVSIGDLVKRRIEDAEHETETLKTYITS